MKLPYFTGSVISRSFLFVLFYFLFTNTFQLVGQSDTTFICWGNTLNSQSIFGDPPGDYVASYSLTKLGETMPVVVNSDGQFGTGTNYSYNEVYLLEYNATPLYNFGAAPMNSSCAIQEKEYIVFLHSTIIDIYPENELTSNFVGDAAIVITGGLPEFDHSLSYELSINGGPAQFIGYDSTLIYTVTTPSTVLTAQVTDNCESPTQILDLTWLDVPCIAGICFENFLCEGSLCNDHNPHTVDDIMIVECLCAGDPINSCTSYPKQLATETSYFCYGDTDFYVPSQYGFVSPNDTAYYILCTNVLDPYNSAISQAGNMADIGLGSNDNYIGQSLYLYHVAMPKTPEGQPNVFSICASFSNPARVVFLSEFPDFSATTAGSVFSQYDEYGNANLYQPLSIHLSGLTQGVNTLLLNGNTIYLSGTHDTTSFIYNYPYSPQGNQLEINLTYTLFNGCNPSATYTETLQINEIVEADPVTQNNGTLPAINGMPSNPYVVNTSDYNFDEDYYLCEYEGFDFSASNILLPCGQELDYTVSYIMQYKEANEPESALLLDLENAIAISSNGFFENLNLEEGYYAVFGVVSPVDSEGNADLSNPEQLTISVDATTFYYGHGLSLELVAYNPSDNSHEYCFSYNGDTNLFWDEKYQDIFPSFMTSYINAEDQFCVTYNQATDSVTIAAIKDYYLNSCYNSTDPIISIHLPSYCTDLGFVGLTCMNADICYTNSIVADDCICALGNLVDVDMDDVCDYSTLDTCVGPNVGDACISDDACYTDTVVQADCNCGGGVLVDTDLDGLCDTDEGDNCTGLNIGDICDDGNPNTTGDIITNLCVCSGTTGISADIHNDILIMPNPANSVMIIQCNTPLDYELYNQLGQLVISQSAPTIVDVRTMPNGIYLLNLLQDGKLITSKKINILK